MELLHGLRRVLAINMRLSGHHHDHVWCCLLFGEPDQVFSRFVRIHKLVTVMNPRWSALIRGSRNGSLAMRLDRCSAAPIVDSPVLVR